jgi:hypothetical protein
MGCKRGDFCLLLEDFLFFGWKFEKSRNKSFRHASFLLKDRMEEKIEQSLIHGAMTPP